MQLRQYFLPIFSVVYDEFYRQSVKVRNVFKPSKAEAFF